MAEPVLPLVTFATGALTFMLIVRTAIDRIVKDIWATEAFAQDLIDLGSDVAELERSLERWIQDWQVFDNAPTGLFRAYWGEEGGFIIQRRIAAVQSRSKELEQKHSPLYAKGLPSLDRPIETSGRNVSQGLSTANGTALAEKQKEAIIHNMTWIERYWKANFKTGLVQESMKFLKTSIESLEKTSLAEFKNTNHCISDVDVPQKRRLVQHKAHLLALAGCNGAASNILLARFLGLKTHLFDLHVDIAHNVQPYDRVKEISRQARAGRAYYLVHAFEREFYTASSLGSWIEAIYLDKQLKSENWRADFQNIIRELIDEMSSDDLKIYFRDTTSGKIFPIAKSRIRSERSESFKSFIESSKRKGLQKGGLKAAEMVRLSCFLAECALLYLQTNWFSTLCSCSLRRVDLGELGHTYTVRTQKLKDWEPGAENSEDTKGHCQHILSDMHLRRVGILLTEIAVGVFVKRAIYDENSKSLEVDLDEERLTWDANDIFAYLEETADAGHLFARAVRYCLKKDRASRLAHAEELESFYDIVVAPMYHRYDEVIVKRSMDLP